jgi:hypothetical protein
MMRASQAHLLGHQVQRSHMPLLRLFFSRAEIVRQTCIENPAYCVLPHLPTYLTPIGHFFFLTPEGHTN